MSQKPRKNSKVSRPIILLENGAITVTYTSPSELVSGEVMRAYYEGIKISASGFHLRNDGIVAVLPITDLPGAPPRGALEITLTTDRAASLERLAWNDVTEFLRQYGHVAASCSINRFSSRSIAFQATFGKLPSVARPCTLLVNGDEVSTGIFLPMGAPHPVVAGYVPQHEVEFVLQATLRGDDLIELIDNSTSTNIFSEVLTWVVLAGGLVQENRRLALQVARIADAQSALEKKFNILSESTNQDALLGRLDLFHAILSAKIDREFRQLPKASGNKRTPPPPPAVGQPDREVSPAEMEGVGLFELEREGAEEWRWFSTHCTLLLRKVDPFARTVSFAVGSVRPGVDLGSAVARANGMPVFLDVRQGAQQTFSMQLALPAGLIQADGTLLIDLQFARGDMPEHDKRLLTFLCTGISIASVVPPADAPPPA